MIPDPHAAAFDALIREVAKCRLCKRMNDSMRIFGRSSGHIRAPVMFVGEAPGRLGADSTSIPFHGDRAGENFEKLIAQAGISRYDCFITNAVLCNPKDAEGNNSTPLRTEIANCSPFLHNQVNLVDPKIIVTLGAQALQALKFVAPHSFSFPQDVRKAHDWNGRTLIPLYHPGQRAMLHRSFLNQLSDYRFVAETLKKMTSGSRRATVLGRTHEDTAAVARILLEAAGPVGYFRLHKLFYLLEYHHVRLTGRRLTKSYVVRQKDGPYFTDLHISKLKRAIPELTIVRSSSSLVISINLPTDLFERSNMSRPGIMRFIQSIADRYRTKTDEQLKTISYLTAPMRYMLRKEKYGGENLFNAPIDFSLARPKHVI